MHFLHPVMRTTKASKILHIRQLPYDISSSDLYDIFGRYGTIRQIRKGVENNTRGTAFVVYDEIDDAMNALENLSGLHVSGRYLTVLFFDTNKNATSGQPRI
ncbi:putative splicing factor 3B subunit 6 [Cryptosporidium felis]|nr:putative splicing factor 3B subunit 6 [Cryptosporidium felis]